MRALTTLLATLLATTALAPLAVAQDNTTGTDPVDVDITDEEAQESATFAGLSSTALIILVVLAVVVIALIVALASRDRY